MPPRNRPHSVRRFPPHPLKTGANLTFASSSNSTGHAKLDTTAIYAKPALRPSKPSTPAPTRRKTRTRKMAGPSYTNAMITIAETLDKHAESWKPEVTTRVEELVGEIIELADADALDILPSRAVQQEVMDVIDDAETK